MLGHFFREVILEILIADKPYSGFPGEVMCPAQFDQHEFEDVQIYENWNVYLFVCLFPSF